MLTILAEKNFYPVYLQITKQFKTHDFLFLDIHDAQKNIPDLKQNYLFILADPKTTLPFHSENKTVFYYPVRLGALLDQINQFHGINDTSDKDDITIGAYVLQPAFYHLVKKDQSIISLTEKEQAILLYLHKHRGHVISRQDLLNKVWEYHDDVKTHTLETHIYRLRQKIETDPARPVFLLTKEQGYCLL